MEGFVKIARSALSTVRIQTGVRFQSSDRRKAQFVPQGPLMGPEILKGDATVSRSYLVTKSFDSASKSWKMNSGIRYYF